MLDENQVIVLDRNGREKDRYDAANISSARDIARMDRLFGGREADNTRDEFLNRFRPGLRDAVEDVMYNHGDVAVFYQLRNYVQKMPLFLLSEKCEYALFLEKSDFYGIRTKEEIRKFLNEYQISSRDKKGEASHGLAIYFNYM